MVETSRPSYLTDIPLQIQTIKQSSIAKISQQGIMRQNEPEVYFNFQKCMEDTEDNFLFELFMIGGSNDLSTEPKKLYTHVRKDDACERRKCINYFCFPDKITLTPVSSQGDLETLLDEY